MDICDCGFAFVTEKPLHIGKYIHQFGFNSTYNNVNTAASNIHSF